MSRLLVSADDAPDVTVLPRGEPWRGAPMRATFTRSPTRDS
ncbi:MAG: hypothetical protein ACM3NS_07670 [Deltaproteobacteria bacterium]